jgi:hypothetical protein
MTVSRYQISAIRNQELLSFAEYRDKARILIPLAPSFEGSAARDVLLLEARYTRFLARRGGLGMTPSVVERICSYGHWSLVVGLTTVKAAASRRTPHWPSSPNAEIADRGCAIFKCVWRWGKMG